MKLLSFVKDGKETWGVVVGDGVADLGVVTGYPTLASFIASADFDRRTAIVAGARADVALADVDYLPVIPRPEKIVCAVRNYMDHHQEAVAAGLNRELSEFPPIFLRVWLSQVAHGKAIVRPAESESLDWEGEVAVVIGKPGRRIPVGQAMSHVAGYSIYNDASVREFQFHAKQIAAGKNFESTGAFGPWLVTRDEIEDGKSLAITTRLNGQVVQSGSTANLIFSIPTLISYASTIFTLSPGDVIVTGTPSGVGFSRKPPLFMKPGDVVEVEVEAIGTLRNPVAE